MPFTKIFINSYVVLFFQTSFKPSFSRKSCNLAHLILIPSYFFQQLSVSEMANPSPGSILPLFLFSYWYMATCVCLLVRIGPYVTPGIVACQAPLSVGFPRQGYWSRLPFPSPGDLPDQGIKPNSPALQADILPIEPSEKSLLLIKVAVSLSSG